MSYNNSPLFASISRRLHRLLRFDRLNSKYRIQVRKEEVCTSLFGFCQS